MALALGIQDTGVSRRPFSAFSRVSSPISILCPDLHGSATFAPKAARSVCSSLVCLASLAQSDRYILEVLRPGHHEAWALALTTRYSCHQPLCTGLRSECNFCLSRQPYSNIYTMGAPDHRSRDDSTASQDVCCCKA